MIGPVMIGSGVISSGVSLVNGGRQGWHDRVPIRVPVYRARRRRRGRTVPDRRRRRFVIVTVAVVVVTLLVVVVVLLVLLVLLLLLVVVVRRGGDGGGGPATAAGRHDVHRGRRQRRRYAAVRAVHRAQRTRPVLGRRALPCGGGGAGSRDGCGRGGRAPRLVVDVLVKLHGGGARSTDDDYYYCRRQQRCCRRWWPPRSLILSPPTGPLLPPSQLDVHRARRKRASEKCCFFLRSGPGPNRRVYRPSTQHAASVTTRPTCSSDSQNQPLSDPPTHPPPPDWPNHSMSTRRVKVIINVSGVHDESDENDDSGDVFAE